MDWNSWFHLCLWHLLLNYEVVISYFVRGYEMLQVLIWYMCAKFMQLGVIYLRAETELVDFLSSNPALHFWPHCLLVMVFIVARCYWIWLLKNKRKCLMLFSLWLLILSTCIIQLVDMKTITWWKQNSARAFIKICTFMLENLISFGYVRLIRKVWILWSIFYWRDNREKEFWIFFILQVWSIRISLWSFRLFLNYL